MCIDWREDPVTGKRLAFADPGGHIGTVFLRYDQYVGQWSGTANGVAGPRYLTGNFSTDGEAMRAFEKAWMDGVDGVDGPQWRSPSTSARPPRSKWTWRRAKGAVVSYHRQTPGGQRLGVKRARSGAWYATVDGHRIAGWYTQPEGAIVAAEKAAGTVHANREGVMTRATELFASMPMRMWEAMEQAAYEAQAAADAAYAASLPASGLVDELLKDLPV